jgi:small subunit ribosomal protein S3
MGQKVNPIGLRLGIIKGWDSNWYGGKDFGQKLVEDDKVRKYLSARFPRAGISKIYIERTLKIVTITIHTARPGLIIGKLGQEVDKLKEELKKITKKEIQININEIKRPELEAVLVAQTIANQVEGRVFYKRAVRSAIGATMRAGAEGIKVSISGRIGGAEMARTEHFKEGRTPLHTLRADIDYNHSEAHTTYGRLGVKVWICKGLIYGKPDLFQSATESRFGSGFDRRDRGGFDRRDRDRGGFDRRDGRDRDRDRDRNSGDRGGRDYNRGGGDRGRDNRGGGGNFRGGDRNRDNRDRDNRDRKRY